MKVKYLFWRTEGFGGIACKAGLIMAAEKANILAGNCIGPHASLSSLAAPPSFVKEKKPPQQCGEAWSHLSQSGVGSAESQSSSGTWDRAAAGVELFFIT